MRPLKVIILLLAAASSLNAQAVPVEIQVFNEGADVRLSGRDLRMKEGTPRRMDASGLVVRGPAIVLADLGKGDVVVELADTTAMADIMVSSEWGGTIEAGAKRIIVRATPGGVVVFGATGNPPYATPRRPRD